MNKILVIEDDSDLLEGLLFMLETEGYRAFGAGTIKRGMELIKERDPDLILLDCNLPDGSGYELCVRVREFSQIPMLMLTARETEMDEIKALELGVDDFMRKPFSLSVLSARLRNLLKRREKQNKVSSNGVVVDKDSCKVHKGGKEVSLSAMEYKLLTYLLENRGQVLAKEQILERIWDSEGRFVDDNTVSVNIRRLRMKIEDDPDHPAYIKTVHGLGYLWREIP